MLRENPNCIDRADGVLLFRGNCFLPLDRTNRMEEIIVHIDYPHNANGLPMMRMADINDLAIRIIQERAPECLEKPMALDIRRFAEESLFLNVLETPIYDESILGLTAFGIVDVPIDTQDHYIAVEDGTILINSDIGDNTYRKRFTLAHEVSHWILHRRYNDRTNILYEFRDGAHSFVAEEDDIRELGKKNPVICQTDDDRAEWQADHLGAALLMPGPIFIKTAQQIMERYNFPKHQLISGERVTEGKRVVKELSDIYQVSYRSVRLRLRGFGMYIGVQK